MQPTPDGRSDSLGTTLGGAELHEREAISDTKQGSTIGQTGWQLIRVRKDDIVVPTAPPRIGGHSWADIS